MQLLLARHGNTFEDGAPSLWIGSQTDLPLTAKGRTQAETLAAALKAASISIAAIYTGPLRRHREHGAIIAKALGQPESTLIIDDRLQEIDYGVWERKSNDDLRHSGFEDQLNAWNKNAVWPSSGVWGESEESLIARVGGFLASVQRETDDRNTRLAITSGGVLRQFYKQCGGNSSAESKVGTGNACSISLLGSTRRVQFWNTQPSALSL